MSSITATYSVVTETYTFVEDNINPLSVDIVAGLYSAGRAIPLQDFSYGFYIRLENGTEVVSRSWPPPGIVFRSTDQPVLETSRVELDYGTTYVVTVWFENFGTLYQGSHTFTTESAPVPVPEEP